MRVKPFVSILLFAFLCCSLFAVAQAPSDNDSKYLQGPGTIGTIPVYFAAKKLKNSSITQDGSGNENFAAGINAVGDVNENNVNAAGAVTGAAYVDGIGGVYSGSIVSANGTGFFFNPVPGPGSYSWITDNTSGSSYAVGGQALASGTSYEYAFFDSAGNAEEYADSLGDTFAVGTKSAVVPLKSGKMVKVYSQESTKVWFEDFGSAGLVGGVATVKLDAKFAQLVNTKQPYHVFLTPNGDCHGLYVSQKGRNSFEVRELNGGQSNVSFDYRISALRNGYENLRLEPANAPKVQKERPALPKR